MSASTEVAPKKKKVSPKPPVALKPLGMRYALPIKLGCGDKVEATVQDGRVRIGVVASDGYDDGSSFALTTQLADLLIEALTELKKFIK